MNRLLPLLLAACFTPAFAVVRPGDLASDMSLGKLLIDGEDWSVIVDGLGFGDGPATDGDGNFYFSDMKAPGIYKIALDGARNLLIDEPASGLKFGPDGRLYACQGSKKRLIAIELKTKAIDVIAENVQPNDLAISRTGQIYFTETGKHQVTRIDIKTKAVSVADTGITAPNGIALSPDQGTLAVSDYRGTNVWTFRVEADGSLSSKAPYMTMRRPIDPKGEFKREEPPPLLAVAGGDGMCSDEQGRFYVATTLGIQVFDPTGRECGLLPRLQLDKPLTSCALAGPGRTYLYMMNGDKIYRRKVQAEGTFSAR
jgi:enterochelin esterase family protein